FGAGFARLALQTNTPVVPFAFIGGGEAIPTVMNLYKIAKLFGAPYIPVTPWILPIPRRVPLRILYGTPIRFSGSASDEDAVIEAQGEAVKQRIAALIGEGAGRHREQRALP